MKTDRKKGVLLAILLMAAGTLCAQSAVRASVLEMPKETTQSSSVSETGETTEDPAAQNAGTSQTTVRTNEQDTALPGIHVGDVDISGMTAEEAKTAVAQFVDSEKSFLMTLDIGDTQITATAGDVGLYWGNTQVIDQAMALGKHGNAVQRFKIKKQLEKGSYTFDLQYAVADATAKSYLEERCAPECNKDPK